MLEAAEVTVVTVECTETALVECACDESIKSSSMEVLCFGSDSPAWMGTVECATFEAVVSACEADEYGCYKDTHEYMSIASE